MTTANQIDSTRKPSGNAFEALRQQLADASYLVGSPPWISDRVIADDAALCAESVCDACGHDGMVAHPFHRPASGIIRRSYVILAACPNCGHCEEA